MFMKRLIVSDSTDSDSNDSDSDSDSSDSESSNSESPNDEALQAPPAKKRRVVADSSDDEVPAETTALKHGSEQRPRAASAAPEARAVSGPELRRAAQAIVQEILQRFPEHAAAVRHVPIEISSRMGSSGAKTVFEAPRGSASPRVRCIRLSLPILSVRANFDTSLRDVMLHELAHCIAGRAAAHGPRWRTVCRAIGGTAAIGHSLSCAGDEEAEEEAKSRGTAAPARRQAGRREARPRRARATGDAWNAATTALISQLIRF